MKEEFGNTEINPEVWLHFLLAFKADEKKRLELHEKIAAHRNLTLEQVNEIFDTLLELLLNMARSN